MKDAREDMAKAPPSLADAFARAASPELEAMQAEMHRIAVRMSDLVGEHHDQWRRAQRAYQTAGAVRRLRHLMKRDLALWDERAALAATEDELFRRVWRAKWEAAITAHEAPQTSRAVTEAP